MSTVTSPIILDSTGQSIKNSIDLLTANINRTASNIAYDNNLTIKGKIDAMELEIASASTADGTEYSSGVSVKDMLDVLASEIDLTNVVRISINYTGSYFIIAGITNISNQDGIHIYFSTTTTRKLTVYKRENGVTTELYSFT